MSRLCQPNLAKTPGELILEIASYLGLQDVNSLIQSSRRYHLLLSHQLYSRAAGLIRSHDGKSPLIWAAERGRVQSIQRLLEQDPEPAKLINGLGAVHFAAAEGHKEALEMLIQAGVPASMPDEDLRTPLQLAALQNQEDIVHFLLASGAGDPFLPDDEEMWEWGKALQNSVALGYESITRALLQAGKKASPDDTVHVNNWIYCQLYSAISTGKCGIMQLLLEFSNTTYIPGVEFQAPVHLAVVNGHEDALQILIDHGADLSIRDQEGDSIIHYAAVGGNDDIVRSLIDSGMDVESPGAFGNTPLMNAVTHNNFEAAKVLLEAGADATKDLHTTDPLINLAAHFASESMIKLLQKYGAQIKRTGRDGRTALHEAALTDNIEVISVLCRAGVPMDLLDVNGNSALHISAIDGHTEFARKLLEMGASVKVGEPGGHTPIHTAARCGHSEILQMLIDAGANARAVDNYGDHTALHYAAMNGNTEVMRILIESFQGKDMKTSQSLQPCHCGRSPLQKAADNGYTDIVQLLVDSGVDVKQFHEGSSALHIATSTGQKETANLLMSLGANPLRLDIYGRSAMDWSTLDTATSEMMRSYFPANPPATDPDERWSALCEGISWLASRALSEGYRPTYRLGKCLLYAEDLDAARISFLIDLQPAGGNGNGMSPAVCDSCSASLIESRFVCRTCPDVDLCFECMAEYQEEGSQIKLCEEHEFMEIRETDKELLEEPVDEFRDRWLLELISKYSV